MIEWSEKFSVGVAKIDEQHKKLVGMLNELHSAMKDGRGKDVLSKILESMLQYAKEHFATEESYMRRYGYPATEAHLSEHKNFEQSAADFYSRYQRGAITTIEVYSYLQKWLVNHILNTDKKMGEFIAGVIRGAGR